MARRRIVKTLTPSRSAASLVLMSLARTCTENRRGKSPTHASRYVISGRHTALMTQNAQLVVDQLRQWPTLPESGRRQFRGLARLVQAKTTTTDPLHPVTVDKVLRHLPPDSEEVNAAVAARTEGLLWLRTNRPALYRALLLDPHCAHCRRPLPLIPARQRRRFCPDRACRARAFRRRLAGLDESSHPEGLRGRAFSMT